MEDGELIGNGRGDWECEFKKQYKASGRDWERRKLELKLNFRKSLLLSGCVICLVINVIVDKFIEYFNLTMEITLLIYP